MRVSERVRELVIWVEKEEELAGLLLGDRCGHSAEDVTAASSVLLLLPCG